jgi:hypothetical protein
MVRVAGLTSEELLHRLAGEGVLVLPLGSGFVRFVVHRAHTDTVVARAVEAVAAVAGARWSTTP